MKKIFITLFALTLTLFSISAITLEEVASNKYKATTMPNVVSSADGKYYAIANPEKSMIFKCEYNTGKIVDTLFNTSTARDCKFRTFEGFEMSQDFRYILLHTEKEKIYRISYKAKYYTVEVKRNLVKPLTKDERKQQIATFSPNGRMVAFVMDGNVYLKKLDYDSQSEVTRGAKQDTLMYGVTSWAYEEEFRFVNSLSWSSDSETLAFLRTNEGNVNRTSMQIYQPQDNAYPKEYSYKYPVSGADCSVTEVYTYTVESRVVKKMDVPVEEGGYIPRILFTCDSTSLAVMTLNREQNLLNIYSVNPKSGVSKLLVKESSKTWVDEKSYNNIIFFDSYFVMPSMRDGNRHLYQYSTNGKLLRQLTKGKWDVISFLGSDGKKNFYYTGNPEGAIYSALYKVDTSGKTTMLSKGGGYVTAQMNPTATHYLMSYSNITTPYQITLNSTTGKTIKTIADNKELKGVKFTDKEFFTFTNPEGIELNGYMLKPLDFSADKKYPVVMMQYSGPGSQRVLNRWEAFDWLHHIVGEGYLVVCVDTRGTGGRGEQFSHCIYRQMGVYESQDQISAAKYLSTLPYVDKNNITIYGWSFGGYTSLMSVSTSKGVFANAVAVAPVTDWHLYDAIYTERYMNTPQANKSGYDITSPLKQALDMNSNLLLISGTADDNVRLINTMQYTTALINAGKQFDMQLYPDCNHSILGYENRLHLYTRICDFIKRNTK
ncbi:MAG: DPP IV N-terminal domain-containing protein [Bacteroidales bacterium]|nr:DPP IV N-terminal domain-containing protein [Bacteroidales bacterium]